MTFSNFNKLSREEANILTKDPQSARTFVTLLDDQGTNNLTNGLYSSDQGRLNMYYTIYAHTQEKQDCLTITKGKFQTVPDVMYISYNNKNHDDHDVCTTNDGFILLELNKPYQLKFNQKLQI